MALLNKWDLIGVWATADGVPLPAPTVDISTIPPLKVSDTGTATANTTNTTSLTWSATGSVSINSSTGVYVAHSIGASTITATATGDSGLTASDSVDVYVEALPVEPPPDPIFDGDAIYNVTMPGAIKSYPNTYQLYNDTVDNVPIYQHSDNVIRIPIKDELTGQAIKAESFSNAEYIIADRQGRVKLRLSTEDDISVVNDEFVVFIDDAKIDSSFKGNMYHQFVVWNTNGDKLPPLFSGKIKVIKVLL